MVDKFRGFDDDEGWMRRELADIRKQLAAQASARRLVFFSVPIQSDVPNLDLPVNWSQYLTTYITVPKGYTTATVTLIATTGDTLGGAVGGTTSGNIGAQPYVNGDSLVSGPALSQGKSGGGAVSIQSSMTAKVGVINGGLSVFMYAYANVGSSSSWNSLAGNVHLNGTVIFGRA